ncbi:MAG: T9SS type A sorting domain-containing protein [Bacteroidales bacterium]
MRNLIFFLCLVFAGKSLSQSVSPEAIFPAGGHHGNGTAQISWTLGDTEIETRTTNNVTLTQGFLQPNFTITDISPVELEQKIKFEVYPNPVKDILNVKMSVPEGEANLVYYLYSPEGRLLVNKPVKNLNSIEEIDFQSYESGYYILKITVDKYNYNKTFKINFLK